MSMKASEIRQKFTEYFEKNGHTSVSSSSLIPAEDPTLLFTNAGMNQFKDCFLGKETRSYKRATTIQKCVRAGGKHNDLDQVGYTERHLTFFEMMGNFSFGDYFKKEAIAFAWEFLTKEMGLPKEKLWASVFKDDQESYDIWHDQVGIPAQRIVKLGEADNFWAMGDTGPCGPCTEIYLDRGPGIGCGKTECLPGCSCARYIEIWNNVFMQFNRQPSGEYVKLTQTGVDTGMGFERLCMVMQGANNLFEIDQFQHLIKAIEKLTGVSYTASTGDTKVAFHVLGDHIRASSLLIADGCSPANDGRGYVLRKIIRRAALFAQKLTDRKTLFPSLAAVFIEQMGHIYPELVTSKKLIISVLESEIERFAANLVAGQNIFQKIATDTLKAGKNLIEGDVIFKLYDTYGFPPELTEIMCKEQGLSIDMIGFDKAMENAKEISGKKMKDTGKGDIAVDNMRTIFVGYETLENTSTVQFVAPDEDGSIWVSTTESPFFVECGGQVNDTGWITINNQKFEVLDLKKAGETFKPAILVKIGATTIDSKPAQPIKVGDSAHSLVDGTIRPSIVKNHTATHMLQAALQTILGPQVKQAGSVVHDKYLRFDFAHHQAMTADEIAKTENLVNEKIWEDIHTNITYATLKQAKDMGVISFFGEKYNPEEVRIVEIPGFSSELCGGTHASSTGIIGAFKIVSETALSTGVRRIVAITGPEAINTFRQSFSFVKSLSEKFKVKPEEVIAAVEKQQNNLQEALTQVKQLKKELFKAQIPLLENAINNVNGIPFLFKHLNDAANDDMKFLCTSLSDKKAGFYFMVSTQPVSNRFSFFAFVSPTVTDQINLKDFSAFLAQNHGLKGGGSGTQLQGGGENLPTHLHQSIIDWLQKRG